MHLFFGKLKKKDKFSMLSEYGTKSSSMPKPSKGTGIDTFPGHLKFTLVFIDFFIIFPILYNIFAALYGVSGNLLLC